MRIAIYGGSFNPPHLGHMEAARTVAAELAPDKLLIIPDNIPPHKEVEPGCPTAEERLELCRLAFRDVPGAEVSDMEIRRHGRIGLRGLFYIVAAIGAAAQVRLLKLAIKLFCSLDIHRCPAFR